MIRGGSELKDEIENPHTMRGNEYTEGRIPSGIMEEERKRGAANEAGMAGYDHGDLAEEAKRQGISKSTAERWNLIWIEKGMVTKENHGIYRKVA